MTYLDVCRLTTGFQDNVSMGFDGLFLLICRWDWSQKRKKNGKTQLTLRGLKCFSLVGHIWEEEASHETCNLQINQNNSEHVTGSQQYIGWILVSDRPHCNVPGSSGERDDLGIICSTLDLRSPFWDKLKDLSLVVPLCLVVLQYGSEGCWCSNGREKRSGEV